MRVRWRTILSLLLFILTISPLFLSQAGAAPKQTSLPNRPVIFVHGYCGTAESWRDELSIRTRLIEDYGYISDTLHIFVYPKTGDKEMNRADIAFIANNKERSTPGMKNGTRRLSKIHLVNVAHPLIGEKDIKRICRFCGYRTSTEDDQSEDAE